MQEVTLAVRGFSYASFSSTHYINCGGRKSVVIESLLIIIHRFSDISALNCLAARCSRTIMIVKSRRGLFQKCLFQKIGFI